MFLRFSSLSFSCALRWSSGLPTLLSLAILSWAGSPSPATVQVITEILDRTGAGSPNSFFGATGIALDVVGNVYVTGFASGNVFKIASGALLENPQPNSFHSGGGVISGFACDAESIEVEIDGEAILETSYGTSRGDMRGACRDHDNGFGLLMNWNLLGDGTHTIRALKNGEDVFARRVRRIPARTQWRVPDPRISRSRLKFQTRLAGTSPKFYDRYWEQWRWWYEWRKNACA